MPPLSARLLKLLPMALLLSACAQFTTGFRPTYNNPYNVADFDELLGFGANMSRMTETSRVQMCKSLLERQTSAPSPGNALHLMLGRLLSDSCGDIAQILAQLAAMPPGALTETRMQQLVAVSTASLKRMDELDNKVGYLQRKQKSIQAVINTKSSKRTKSSKKDTGSSSSKNDKDEAQLLREKLEAIRDMEKQMDDSGGGN